MNPPMVQRILGQIVLMFSLSMLPPAAISLFLQDEHWAPFLEAFAIVLGIGLLLYLPVRRIERDLRLRDGFLIVAGFWVVLGVMGAVPLLLTDTPRLSFTDAVFEAVSGFTTTGATTIVGLDGLPASVLWYRQQIQWLGGGGIIVLAVALFPVLGIGGMQLYKAETPGPVKDEKLTPRIARTAKTLWIVYVVLTLACAVAYALAGMGWLDAVEHALTTLSTGGFSPYDASLGHFDSYAIDMVAVVFMFLGGANFTLHYLVWRGRSLRSFWRDPQFRAYLSICATFVLVTVGYLLATGTYGSLGQAFRYGSLQVVSFQTSTGYSTVDFAAWPGMLPVLLVLSTFIGGCAGSTAGGMKVIRWQLVIKEGMRELKRLLHPSAELPVKLANKPVPVQVLATVTGFFAMYLIIFGLAMLVLMALGLDQVTAWSAVATSINNLGPGLGEVAANFTSISAPVKWVCVALMLIGRLEVFTLLVLLTPTFWRR